MSAVSPRSDIDSPTTTPRAKHRVKFLTVDDLRRGLQRNHVPVLQLFSKLDTNQDGRISVREARVGLRRMLATLGYNAGQSVVTRLFHRLDKDNSGFIDYAEFHRAIAPRKLADPPPDRRSSMKTHEHQGPESRPSREWTIQRTRRDPTGVLASGGAAVLCISLFTSVSALQ